VVGFPFRYRQKEALEERVKKINLLEIYVSKVAISFILFLRRTAIFHRQGKKKELGWPEQGC
jgi:hypothetical protein